MRITSADGERMGGFARFLVTILVLAGIFLTAVFFAVRTQGGREFVKDQLEKRLGMKFSIGSTRIGWPYVLVIEDLESVDSAPGGEPIVKAQELRVGLGVRTRWHVSIHRCVLNLVRDRDSGWRPEVFSKLGDLPLKALPEISNLTVELRKSMCLYVKDSSIRWLNSKGDVMASASGISFHVMPVKLPDHRMYHHRLSIYNAVYADRTRDHDIQKEWLSSDARGYVEIHSSSRETAGSAMQSSPRRGPWRAKRSSRRSE